MDMDYLRKLVNDAYDECERLNTDGPLYAELLAYIDKERQPFVAGELARARSELAIAGPLLAVVALMDDDDRAGTMKVHRDSMESIDPLFGPGDGRTLYLRDAAARFVDGKFSRGKTQ